MIHNEGIEKKIWEDSVPKKVVLEFDSFTLSNETIANNDFTFVESLCTANDLTLGACESSTLEFKLLNKALPSMINKRFKAYYQIGTVQADLSYLRPYKFKGKTAKDFNDAEFTAKEFNETEITVKQFNEEPIYYKYFKSLLVTSLNTTGTFIYYTVNNVLPYLRIYKYDAGQTVLLDDPVQPHLPIKFISIDGNVLRAYSESKCFVYTINGEALTLTETLVLNELEKQKVTNTNVNTYYGDTLIEIEGIHAVSHASLPIGTFTVKEAVIDANESLLSCKCYDDMIKFDIDCSEWFNTLPYPLTLQSLFENLCIKIGVTYSSEGMVNASMIVQKMTEVSGITGRDILKWIGEASASFPHFSREGILRLKTLQTSEKVNVPYYFAVKEKEYVVPAIDKLQINTEEDDIGVIVGDGMNLYTITANPLLFTSSDADLRPIAENIFNAIKDIAYIPFELKTKGNPLFEVGDVLNATTRKRNLDMLVLNQSIKGAKSIITEAKATGSESRGGAGPIQRSVIQLKGKTNVLKRTVEATVSELKDFEADTSSKLTQTAESIELKVDKQGIISAINISQETIKIDAKKVELSGDVIIRDQLSTPNSGVIINGDLIRAGKISGDRVEGGTIYGSTISWGDGSSITSSTASDTRINSSNRAVISASSSIRLTCTSSSGWITLSASAVDCDGELNMNHNDITSCGTLYASTVDASSLVVSSFNVDDLYASNIDGCRTLTVRNIDNENRIICGGYGQFWDLICDGTFTDKSDVNSKRNIEPLGDVSWIYNTDIYQYTMVGKYKQKVEKEDGTTEEIEVEKVGDDLIIGVLANSELFINNDGAKMFVKEVDGQYYVKYFNICMAGIKALQEQELKLEAMRRLMGITDEQIKNEVEAIKAERKVANEIYTKSELTVS